MIVAGTGRSATHRFGDSSVRSRIGSICCVKHLRQRVTGITSEYSKGRAAAWHGSGATDPSPRTSLAPALPFPLVLLLQLIVNGTYRSVQQ